VNSEPDAGSHSDDGAAYVRLIMALPEICAAA
jgi:hypothetical protein